MAYRDCPYTAVYRAMNVSTGAAVTGDAGNHTQKINADGTDATPARDPIEIAYGHYALHLSGAENSGARMMVHGSSRTSNVVLVPTSWNNRPAQIGCIPIATYG